MNGILLYYHNALFIIIFKNKVIPAFINRVKAADYKNVGVYSGVSQLDTTNGNTNTPTIRSYPIWVSQYYKNLQF